MKQPQSAAPYAKALFALAKERDQTELVGHELADVAATFGSDLEPPSIARSTISSSTMYRLPSARPSFIVESGSVVLDGSLEGQLERMRRRLASG